MSQSQIRGLLSVAMDVEPGMEDELARWYADEHLPARLAVPGVLGARRFRALTGAPRFLTLYELQSPEVLDTDAYVQVRKQTPWDIEIHRHISNHVRNVYAEIPIVPSTRKKE